jgi:hypothetical protein
MRQINRLINASLTIRALSLFGGFVCHGLTSIPLQDYGVTGKTAAAARGCAVKTGSLYQLKDQV